MVFKLMDKNYVLFSMQTIPTHINKIENLQDTHTHTHKHTCILSIRTPSA